MLDDELGAFQHGSAGDDLVCEGHLFLSEVGKVADRHRDAVDLRHLVLLQFLDDRIDQGGYDRNFVH